MFIFRLEVRGANYYIYLLNFLPLNFFFLYWKEYPFKIILINLIQCFIIKIFLII